MFQGKRVLASARVATPEDLDDIRLLVDWSDRAHLRFQVSQLPLLVRDGCVCVTHEDERMEGVVYTTVDYPNSSIRGFVVRPGGSTERVVQATMSYLLPVTREAGSLNLTFIGDDRWLVPYLIRSGFTRAGGIIGFNRPGSYLYKHGSVSCRTREVQEEDLEDIVAVDWTAFDLFWRNGRQTIKEFMAQMPYFLVAVLGDSLVGYVCGTRYSKVGHIVRLAVNSEHHGRGIGTRLMHDIMKKMAADGVRSISLNTQQDNVKSQAFYRSLGFYANLKPTSVYCYRRE